MPPLLSDRQKLAIGIPSRIAWQELSVVVKLVLDCLGVSESDFFVLKIFLNLSMHIPLINERFVDTVKVQTTNNCILTYKLTKLLHRNSHIYCLLHYE